MWLHPWALGIGLMAAAAPLVIHWLTRPRPRRLPLSTLRFVREAVRQQRVPATIRNWLLLLLRTATIALLALAIARPLWGRKAAAPPVTDASVARVVLVDQSQSLAAISNGVQLFERARTAAANELAYQPGLLANVVLIDSQPKPAFAGLSSNLGALKEQLQKANPQPHVANVSQAIHVAAEQLATVSNGTVRELVILSDFQRTNWATADFSVLPVDTKIRLESVSPEEMIPNLAITEIRIDGRVEVSRPARLQVEVGNFSNERREVQVDLRFGPAAIASDKPLYSAFQLRGTCQPLSKTVLTSDVIPTEVGWMAGIAELTALDGGFDGIPADNTRACVWDVRSAPNILLLSQQSGKQRPSSSYFLEVALSPGESRRRTAKGVTRITPGTLTPQTLAGADLVVLDHPGLLSDGDVKLLTAASRRGLGLLYVVGEAIDATNLGQLGTAIGGPAPFPVRFAPAPATRTEPLFVVSPRRDEAPFDLFGDQLSDMLRELRIIPGVATFHVEGALKDDLLAGLSDGSAFLIATGGEAGAIGILNVNLEASNLAASPMFVPMLGELIQRRLLTGRRHTAEINSGESAAIFLPPTAAASNALKVAGPQGAEAFAGQIEAGGAGGIWQIPKAGPTGLYLVVDDGKIVSAAASTISPLESDLRTLKASVFEDRLAGQRNVTFTSTTGLAEQEIDTGWVWLIAACALSMLSEAVLLRVFRC